MSNAQYWFELAEYDLATAQAMLQTGRLVYVAFMCHQVAEKALKGVCAQTSGEMPPRTHDLLRLARACGLEDSMGNERLELLLRLQPLNVESRYPADRAALEAALTPAVCDQMIQGTREFLRWLTQRLRA